MNWKRVRAVLLASARDALAGFEQVPNERRTLQFAQREAAGWRIVFVRSEPEIPELLSVRAAVALDILNQLRRYPLSPGEVPGEVSVDASFEEIPVELHADGTLSPSKAGLMRLEEACPFGSLTELLRHAAEWTTSHLDEETVVDELRRLTGHRGSYVDLRMLAFLLRRRQDPAWKLTLEDSERAYERWTGWVAANGGSSSLLPTGNTADLPHDRFVEWLHSGRDS